MYTYNVLQWLLFFYIYCFLGWIWETLYVSIGTEKWVNRGFMHGPFLPIYGFGGVGIVMATIPVQGNIPYEFIVGIIGATIMEYFTGAMMEKVFHLRYWDYSNNKFNLNGFISLKSSLAWGVFAVVISEVLHVKIEQLVLRIPYTALEILVILLTAYIAADFSASFREALDMKEILANLTQSNQEIARIEKRVEVLSAFVGGELKERSEAGLKMINTTITENKLKYQKTTESLMAIKDKIADSIEKLMSFATEGDKASDADNDKRKHVRDELEIYRESIYKEENKLLSRNSGAFKRVLHILERNPNVVSAEYSDALSEIKELNQEEDNKKTTET